MDVELIDDAELVARSQHRDAHAFGHLVERHQRLVFGVALARCGDPALAEDLAQEAFVTAWRDIDRLRDVDRVGSWVAGIARNLAANAARVQGRRSVELPAPPVDAAPSPEDEAVEREDRELLRRALADVDASYREALVLYYMEGEPVARIAAALGIREDLVKQRLSRGRRALRDGIAARVESALSRARTRPGFRIGVLAALSAAGARDASAATAGAAGKVILGMSAKQLVAATVVVLALGGGAIWLGTRASARDGATAPAAKAPAPAPAATTAPAPGPGGTPTPHVRRLADPATRTALLDEIRRTARRRQGAAATATTGGGATGPTAPAPAPSLEGDLDKEYIRSAVQGLIPMLAECYSQGLERDPNLGAGNVVVEFTIEGEPEVGGVVGESTIDEAATDLADRTVRECIQETMYALEIDPPPAGGVIKVRYPFAFAPSEGEAPTPGPSPGTTSK